MSGAPYKINPKGLTLEDRIKNNGIIPLNKLHITYAEFLEHLGSEHREDLIPKVTNLPSGWKEELVFPKHYFQQIVQDGVQSVFGLANPSRLQDYLILPGTSVIMLYQIPRGIFRRRIDLLAVTAVPPSYANIGAYSDQLLTDLGLISEYAQKGKKDVLAGLSSAAVNYEYGVENQAIKTAANYAQTDRALLGQNKTK